jgi:translation initiation factor IF-2
LEDELKALMEKNMPKERSLSKEGSAKVQQIFQIKGKQKDLSSIAGLVVQSGTLRSGGHSGTGTVGGVTYLYKVMMIF